MARWLCLFAALAALYGNAEAGTPWVITSPNTAIVAENSLMNTILVNITTADPVNVSFAITGQTPESTPRKFMIHNDMLVVAKDNNLDFENQSSYIVDIKGVDPSDPTNTRSTQGINVTVTDVNEAPIITVSHDSTLVLKDTKPGDTIEIATAMDPEGDAVTYWIKANTNPGATFAIDQNGNITLAAGKDLGTSNTCIFDLGIMANDTGSQVLTGSTDLNVVIFECTGTGSVRLVSGFTFVLAHSVFLLINYFL